MNPNIQQYVPAVLNLNKQIQAESRMKQLRSQLRKLPNNNHHQREDILKEMRQLEPGIQVQHTDRKRQMRPSTQTRGGAEFATNESYMEEEPPIVLQAQQANFHVKNTDLIRPLAEILQIPTINGGYRNR